MTPEQERALANRIFLSLCELDGYIASFKITFVDDHHLYFEWSSWFEERNLRTEISKTFSTSFHRQSMRTEVFVDNYDVAINLIKSTIMNTVHLDSGDIELLRSVSGNHSSVTIPRLDIDSPIYHMPFGARTIREDQEIPHEIR